MATGRAGLYNVFTVGCHHRYGDFGADRSHYLQIPDRVAVATATSLGWDPMGSVYPCHDLYLAITPPSIYRLCTPRRSGVPPPWRIVANNAGSSYQSDPARRSSPRLYRAYVRACPSRPLYRW